MADGYGFGGEGDWKTAALVRAMKVMAAGLPGGTSFMEDYTYHLDPKRPKVLGAHMLEDLPVDRRRPARRWRFIRSSSAARPTRCGWCSTPHPGPAVNAAVIDMGNRFRMIVNEVDVVAPTQPLPKLPVARALWQPAARPANGGRGVDPRRRLRITPASAWP